MSPQVSAIDLLDAQRYFLVESVFYPRNPFMKRLFEAVFTSIASLMFFTSASLASAEYTPRVGDRVAFTVFKQAMIGNVKVVRADGKVVITDGKGARTDYTLEATQISPKVERYRACPHAGYGDCYFVMPGD